MKHTIEFKGGRVEFNLLPMKVMFDIADLKGDAGDTDDLSGATQRKIADLLDGYVVGVTVALGEEVNGLPKTLGDELAANTFSNIVDTPLPWGLLAFEAMLDFCLPGTTPAGSTSAS